MLTKVWGIWVFVQGSAAPDELHLGHMAKNDIQRVSHLTQASIYTNSISLKILLHPLVLGSMIRSGTSKRWIYLALCLETTSLPQSTRLLIFKMHSFAIQVWDSFIFCGRLYRVHVPGIDNNTLCVRTHALLPRYVPAVVSSQLEFWKDSNRKRREQTLRTSCGVTSWDFWCI